MIPTETFFPPLLIRASAGTGKTFGLTNRYLNLLCAGESADRILATTFTRKAAGEILSRVFVRLASAALSHEGAQKLGSELGGVELSQKTCGELLKRLIQNQHRLSICTLDSLCVKICKSFSLELGLSAGWNILDESAAHEMRQMAVLKLLSTEDKSILLELLLRLSRGSTSRSVFETLLRKTSDLYQIYLNSPAQAWSWKQDRQLPSAEAIQSLCQRISALAPILSKKGEPNKNWLKANNQAAENLNNRDWIALVSTGLAKVLIEGRSDFYKTPIPDAYLEVYEEVISCAGTVLKRQLAEQTAAAYEILRKFDLHFSGLKQHAHAYHFSDLKSRLAGAAFRGELESLYFRLDGRVAHLLLDEFQDTSIDEWECISPIASEILAQSGTERSFFCVGDLKQAIYAWRGGVAEIFDSLENWYPQLRQHSQSLTRSFRSADEVMQLVNQVFSELEGNPALKDFAAAATLWKSRFLRHETAKTELTGRARLIVSPTAEGKRQQVQAVLKLAAQLVKQASQEHPGAEIAVLVQRNEMVARVMFELQSPEINVACSEEGGVRLATAPAVAVVKSFLKLVDNPLDSVASFHLARSPLGEVLGIDNFNNREKIEYSSSVFRRQVFELGLGRAVAQLVERLRPLSDERDWARLEKLIELAFQYETTQRSVRLADFIRRIELTRVEDPRAALVRVMTVHQAKGLEFDVVILPELDEVLSRSISRSGVLAVKSQPLGAFEQVVLYPGKELRAFEPRWQEMYLSEQKNRMVESLNVLYVALTRARHEVLMLLAPDSEKSDTRAERTAKDVTLPCTFAGILRGALAPQAEAEPESELFVLGKDYQLPRILPQVEQPGTAPRQLSRVGLAEAPAFRTRSLRRLSPSELEGGRDLCIEDQIRLTSPLALLRGTILHSCFSQVMWLDSEPIDFSALTKFIADTYGSNVHVDQVIAEFKKAIEIPAIRNFLCRKSYDSVKVPDLKLWRERRFAVRRADDLFAGAFDRVVVFESKGKAVGAELIDFKSDTIEAAAISERVKFYQPQIEVYQYALTKLLRIGLDAIKTRLVFVSPAEVVTI